MSSVNKGEHLKQHLLSLLDLFSEKRSSQDLSFSQLVSSSFRDLNMFERHITSGEAVPD
jgi:hypothetical protein